MQAYDLIATGTTVCEGIVSGPVRLVKSFADVANVQHGDIMVVAETSPAFVVGVMKSNGLICERGGMLAHICIVCMELGIPCVARVERATELLSEGMVVTLDAVKGIIYSGAGPEGGPTY